MIEVRHYGAAGPGVVLLHGGPGAPGYMAPIARRLASSFRVLEPFQRPSGGAPLTVRTHIEDLHAVLDAAGEPVLLVGSSWGAMLALTFAAEHPRFAAGIVLIGCGTFDAASRERYEQTVRSRTSAEVQAQIDALSATVVSEDDRLIAKSALLKSAYSHDLTTTDLEFERVDARSNRETWNDMLRLQEAGVYPQAFSVIHAPVLMLHGSWDPHPGTAIRDSLLPFLPQLEYREWPDCGHYPWLERRVHDEFYAMLESWLHAVSRRPPALDPH